MYCACVWPLTGLSVSSVSRVFLERWKRPRLYRQTSLHQKYCSEWRRTHLGLQALLSDSSGSRSAAVVPGPGRRCSTRHFSFFLVFPQCPSFPEGYNGFVFLMCILDACNHLTAGIDFESPQLCHALLGRLFIYSLPHWFMYGTTICHVL